MRAFLLALVVLLAGCGKPTETATAATGRATLMVASERDSDVMVFIAFGADSAITGWPACPPTTRLNCQFSLAQKAAVTLPLGGKYLNATLAVGKAPGCGTTKAELNLNNPRWYDVVDISLVDGFDSAMGMTVAEGGHRTVLGPVTSSSGNEKALGVFPLGCDVCTAREHPPCGLIPGKDGCKAGTQYKPDVPCQIQGATKGGGLAVTVSVR